MTEDEVLGLFERCSNVGRWGTEDELGTLNHITPETRRAALAGVTAGEVVPLGLPLPLGRSRQHPPSSGLSVRRDALGVSDSLTLSVHGFEMTHLDALGHVFHEGRMWGGRPSAAALDERGLRFGSVAAAGATGIVTRGVLLDVARSRGVPWLEAGEGIGLADIEAAERLAEARVGRGDAVFVRSGHGRRLAAEGGTHDETAPHEGLLPEVLPWLFDREVAVYAGDCIERRPAGYARVPMPLHQVGLVAMGLWLLDCPDLERLADACASHQRSTFVVVVAPLRVPGGTASAVNPLALF